MSPRTARSTPTWTIYVGVIVTAITIGWQIASNWFGLLNRVDRLEREQNFIHGSITLPGERER